MSLAQMCSSLVHRIIMTFSFYCVMLRDEIACRLSVHLSVRFTYRDHIGWNTSKIIPPPNTLRSLLTLTLTWAIWLTDNSLQSADKDQQEMRAMAEKLHIAVWKCTVASHGHPCDSVASCFCLHLYIVCNCLLYKYI